MDQVQTTGTDRALAGVRVVELSRFDAGASCAEFLAWLGADVVKIEHPTRDEACRYATTEKDDVDSYDFILLNANKRSVACDLESECDKENLRQLIANADVVVEHMAPGAIEKLGFGYDTVRNFNPRIIYAQIKTFASGGPRANYLGGDMVAQALGGPVSGTGFEDGAPMKPGSTLGDTGTALNCVMGVLAALHQRHVTGRGQKVEVSMQDAVINIGRVAVTSYLLGGKPWKRSGNASRSRAVPSNLFPCKPGGPNDHLMIHISTGANRHWQRLLTVMQREDLSDDPRYSTVHARIEHRDEVNALVTAWCQEHTKLEAMDAIQSAGAPAGAVLDMEELTNDSDLRKRGMFVAIEHPMRGALTMPGWPVKMSDSHVPLRSAPLLGAHTDEVLSEWLNASSSGNHESRLDEHVQGSEMKYALSGVKVVDLTQFEAGTCCTQMLAWLGADVVKIEEPTRGDSGRFGNTEKAGVDSYYFIVLNSNKRSVACNLKSEHGKEVLRKLIMKADVLVENMAPGSIERLGFGYDVVRQLNPKIVFAQVKGFASDGPRANYVSFDVIAQSVGGSLSVTGVADKPPLKPGATTGDEGAGMHCVTGIVAALCQRQRTGRGQRIEVAMQEAVINFCRSTFASYLASGKQPARYGNRGIFQCKGGGPNDYCFIDTTRITDQQWQRLLQAMGRQNLLGDTSSVPDAQNADGLLAAWCRERSKIEVMDIMQGAGVPAGAVLDTQELTNDPDLRKSGMFAVIDHPVRGPIPVPACPIKMSEFCVPVRSAPLLGAHNEEVLSEWLGLSKHEIGIVHGEAVGS